MYIYQKLVKLLFFNVTIIFSSVSFSDDTALNYSSCQVALLNICESLEGFSAKINNDNFGYEKYIQFREGNYLKELDTDDAAKDCVFYLYNSPSVDEKLQNNFFKLSQSFNIFMAMNRNYDSKIEKNPKGFHKTKKEMSIMFDALVHFDMCK